mmetsp:Transcript_10056/g.14113  ORF Transcript_10056/g.14113 Transcript_10056/m.14113 type:complete len:462 (+) Transcript_10056:19-1404(+)
MPHFYSGILLVSCLLLLCVVRDCHSAEAVPTEKEEASSSSLLFEPSKDIQVLGPSNFPKPSWKTGFREAKVVLEPHFGTHRPDADVVMAYAEGYTLPYYLSFVESLKAVGFEGDIVLFIAQQSYLKDGVEEYLRAQPHMIVYQANLTCYKEDRITKGPRSILNGQPDIFQMCSIDHAYAVPKVDGKAPSAQLDDDTITATQKEESESSEWTTVEDPREGRAVATLRYELYWMWSLHYNPRQWIMVVDARDSYFQSNPFADVPRRPESTKGGGLLHFFGENSEATRLGLSRKNKNWIQRGYGSEVLEALKNKPTICSGATMGEQVGMEMYLRAMVNEKDESPIRMTGADQGFHNYLYYSSKLAGATAIEKIVLWEQGLGVVNNLGALREISLEERGILNATTYEVYNNVREDTKQQRSLSPVVHQWDRDKTLFHHRHGKVFDQLSKEWNIKKQTLKDHAQEQ